MDSKRFTTSYGAVLDYEDSHSDTSADPLLLLHASPARTTSSFSPRSRSELVSSAPTPAVTGAPRTRPAPFPSRDARAMSWNCSITSRSSASAPSE